MLLGVDQIVELGTGIVALAQLAEGDATAGAAAIVGEETDKALGGSQLRRVGVAADPAVGDMGLGATVDEHDQRVAFARGVA